MPKQNYKEKQELIRTTMQSAGLISERYSSVSKIVFRMTYFHSTTTRVLMTRTLNFFPGNYAYFQMDCLREECIDGGFDLTSVVAEMIKNRKRSMKGTIFCRGRKKNTEAIAGSPSHASIAYEIKVDYISN